MGNTPSVSVWRKTILLGIYASGREYLEALKKMCTVPSTVADMLRSDEFVCGGEKGEVHLEALSIGELGFLSGAQYNVVCSHLPTVGLEVCSVEVAVALRLQYKEQSPEERFLFAMKPIVISDIPRILDMLKSGGKLRLDDRYGDMSRFWRSNTRLICVRRGPIPV